MLNAPIYAIAHNLQSKQEKFIPTFFSFFIFFYFYVALEVVGDNKGPTGNRSVNFNIKQTINSLT